MKTHIFTRKELYDLVWQMPMTKLSKQVGLSDQGLAKLCKRHEIPIPQRGHWAKLAAGKNVIQTPFQETADNKVRERIVIRPVVKAQSLPKPEALEALAATPKPNVRVPKKLVRLHPVLQHWRDEEDAWVLREKRWQSHLPESMRDGFRKPDTDIQKRRYRILDTIFKAVEKFGYKVEPGSYIYSWELTYDGIPVEFKITERYKQVKRPLTKEERVEPWYKGKAHKIERQLTGRLQLNIKSWLPRGLTTRWAEETDGNTLEEDVPDIVRTFKAAGPLLVERRREHEEQRRRDEEERSLRYRAAERIKADKECWERFVAASAATQEAARAREMIRRIEEMAASQDTTMSIGGMTIAEWIDWAKNWANTHDPLASDLAVLFDYVSQPRIGKFS